MDQIFAIIWLRFKLISHKLRTASGIVNLISTILLSVMGAMLSLGIAAGFATMTYFAVQSGDELYLKINFYIVFYTFLLFGVILPIMFAAGSPGFESSRFLVFPISRKKLYGITLAACFGQPEHLFYYPALIAICITGILLPGINVWFGLWIILFILLFYIVWGNTIVLVFQTIMKKRRIREIVALISFMILIFFSIGLILMQELTDKIKSEEITDLISILHAVVKVGKILPPSMAAEGLYALHHGETLVALQNIFGLIVWVSAGMALGYYIFMNYHLGEKGKSPKSKTKIKTRAEFAKSSVSLSLDAGAFSFIPIEILAVASKDLRYLFRSVIGKFNLFIMPVFVIIVVFTFARQVKNPVMGIDPQSLVLFAMLLYATMFSNNFVNNSFAWEGSGIKSYFLSPVPLQKIIIGKNLAVWVYNALLFAICMVTWGILAQIPDPLTFLTCILLYSVSILAFTMGGNIVSIMFPVSRDISTIRNTPSQTAILLSFLSLLIIVAIVFVALVIPMLIGMKFLQPVFLAILLAIQTLIYSLILRLSARLMDGRREQLMETLK